MFDTKEKALEHFEINQKEWLDKARQVAKIICSEKGTVTTDDVRGRLEFPEGFNKKTLGAMFSDKNQWRAIGYLNSRIKTSHSRIIRVFERV